MSIEGDMAADSRYYQKQRDLDEHGVMVDGRDLVRLMNLIDALRTVTGTTADRDHLRWTYELMETARDYQRRQEAKRKKRG